MWTKAVTVDVCKECGEDILPDERLRRVTSREPDMGIMRNYRITLCSDCGELWQESQELGNDER